MKAISLIHFTLASINAFTFIRQMSAGVAGREDRGWKERKGRKGRKNSQRATFSLVCAGKMLQQAPAGRVQGGVRDPDPSLFAVSVPADAALALTAGWVGDFLVFLCWISPCSCAPSQRRLPSASASPRQAILSAPRSASL